MKNISITQAIIFTVAGLAILIAVFLFAFYKGNKGEQALSGVVIWGTLPQEIFNNLLDISTDGDPAVKVGHVTYIEKDPETFDEEFVNALAEGRGPDVVLLRENQIIKNESKLLKIPFDIYDLNSYQNLFVDEANILVTAGGYLGVPYMIDPLVLYYNRDILNSNGIARVPNTWTELLSIAPKLNIVDANFNVSKSAIALGEIDNIKSSKEILWTLLLQAGGQLITRVLDQDGQIYYQSQIGNSGQYTNVPAETALNFYTQFSNPSKTIYSWNRSMPNSQDYFLAGNSAFYLGFASEIDDLNIKNPNLNFNVAEVPQAKDADRKVTYGKLYFFGVSRNSANALSAWQTMLLLTDADLQSKLSSITGLPSVRRDLLTSGNPSNSYDLIFRKSVLYSNAVLEPGAKVGDKVVSEMVKSIISGEEDLAGAINRAEKQLENELEK